jgi:hypothetical protein
MKFLNLNLFDVAKAVEVAQASDKVWASPPAGAKILSSYVTLSPVFPNQPPNTMVGFSITEAENAEAMAAVHYPMMIAGATIHAIPILELPLVGAIDVEKKYKG